MKNLTIWKKNEPISPHYEEKRVCVVTSVQNENCYDTEKRGFILASNEQRTRRKGIGGCSLRHVEYTGFLPKSKREQNPSNRRLEMMAEKRFWEALKAR